jgi:hypothetical protein
MGNREEVSKTRARRTLETRKGRPTSPGHLASLQPPSSTSLGSNAISHNHLCQSSDLPGGAGCV